MTFFDRLLSIHNQDILNIDLNMEHYEEANDTFNGNEFSDIFNEELNLFNSFSNDIDEYNSDIKIEDLDNDMFNIDEYDSDIKIEDLDNDMFNIDEYNHDIFKMEDLDNDMFNIDEYNKHIFKMEEFSNDILKMDEYNKMDKFSNDILKIDEYNENRFHNIKELNIDDSNFVDQINFLDSDLTSINIKDDYLDNVYEVLDLLMNICENKINREELIYEFNHDIDQLVEKGNMTLIDAINFKDKIKNIGKKVIINPLVVSSNVAYPDIPNLIITT